MQVIFTVQGGACPLLVNSEANFRTKRDRGQSTKNSELVSRMDFQQDTLLGATKDMGVSQN